MQLNAKKVLKDRDIRINKGVKGFKIILSLSKPRRATTHDFSLAYQLGVELGAVECEINVKVDAVESALGGIHALKVLFEVFP